jgi:gamma-glutamyltranspeptidase
VVLNVVDFGMGVQEACASPTVDASSMHTIVDSRIPSGEIRRLEAMGHRMRVVVSSPWVAEFSRPSGILIDHDAGFLHGGVEVFGAAKALGR